MNHAAADRVLKDAFGDLLISRAQWGALEYGQHPNTRALSKISFSAIDSLVVHHWGGAVAPDNPTLAESAAAVRATQLYHLGHPGGVAYVDLAYNWTADHAGRLFVARGWHMSGATGGANSHTWAVSLHGNYDRQRPPDAVFATVALLRQVVDEVTR